MAERVDPRGDGAVGPHRSWDGSIEHDRLETEFDNRVVKLAQGFVGREGWDDRYGFEPVPVPVEDLGIVPIERPRPCPADFVVGVRQQWQTEARIEQRIVDPDLIESSVQQFGQRHGHSVECVLGRKAVEHTHWEEASLEAVLAEATQAFEHLAASLFPDDVVDEGQKLEQVPVTVHDWMVETIPDTGDVDSGQERY